MTALVQPPAGCSGFVTITCGHCRLPSDYDKFMRTEIFGDLPHDEYQCPRCQQAWRRERCDAPVWPQKSITIVPIASRL